MSASSSSTSSSPNHSADNPNQKHLHSKNSAHKKNWRYWNKKLASLKLAVFILLSIAVFAAAGTIIESKYDATAASKWVYRTIWMMGIMILLAVNLTAVMADRWPWKRRHIPFLLAHIGIIILLIGAFLSQKWGLDGTIRFGIGEKNRFVVLPETDLQVWASFDGDKYTKSFDESVDFFLNSPAKKPVAIPIMNGEIKVVDYWPYAIGSSRIEKSDSPQAQPALQFVIKNTKVGVNQSAWLMMTKKNQPVSTQMGPLKLTLSTEFPLPQDLQQMHQQLMQNQARPNQVVFVPRLEKTNAKGLYNIDVYLINKDASKKIIKKTVAEGEFITTDWMGMEIQPFEVLPKAENKWHFKQLSAPTPMSTSVIKTQFNSKSGESTQNANPMTDQKIDKNTRDKNIKEQWIQLNDVVKFFSQDSVYILTYGNHRHDLGFELKLKKFEVGRYQGTMRAASYQSRVETPDGVEHLISMNEPLKYNGLTFYQASFEDGPDGQPVASILSVNYDPGRFLKYLGSIILSLGIVWLFYDKRKAARSRAPKDGAIV